MSPDLWITLFLLGLLLALAGSALHHRHRSRRIKTAPSQDRLFRCQRCHAAYTDDPDVERSRCPQCGLTNEPAGF